MRTRARRRWASIAAAFSWLALSASSFAQTPSASTSASSAEVQALPDLAARVTPSVLLLHVLDESGHELGTGTGFFVSADGRVITNDHVAGHAAKMTATTSDGRSIGIAGLLAVDEENDLALLQAEGSGYPALPLVGMGNARIGDEVVVVGSPHGLSASVSTGIVAAVREHGLPPEEGDERSTTSWSVQITAAILPGSSGSPVLDRHGDVIAVVVGGISNSSGLAFAIRAELARALSDRVATGTKPHPFREPTSTKDIARNIGISVGAFALIAIAWFVVPRWRRRGEARSRAIPMRRR
jgi:S1-C subfamily serine protease